MPTDGIRPEQYSVDIERNVTFHTSDGVALVADIYHPRTKEKIPTILVRVPFSHTFKNSLGADVIGEFWASRGYTAVIQGTRGRYKSGGNFYPLLHERQDGIETLRWLANQPWFDGRLGMWGGSAFGHTQWAVADQDSPGPNALIIQIASTDFHGMFHPGGAFSLESALFWAVRSHGTEDKDPSMDALVRGFDGLPMIDADRRAIGHDIAFFRDWLKQPTSNSYWNMVDGTDRARTIKAPVLLMAGWYDPFLPTQLRDYETIKRYADSHIATQSRLIVGPWVHADAVQFPDGSNAGNYRPASLAPTLPWFDHYLLNRPLADSLIAPVRIYVMGENIWRNEQEWPLARTQYTPLYLHSTGDANSENGKGLLSFEMPRAQEPADVYAYNPKQPVPSRGGAMLGPRAGIQEQNSVESRDDVLIYSTDMLTSDMEVTGPVKAVLYVQTDAPHTDFTVKLTDVHPNGKTYNVSDGILRRAYTAQEGPHEISIELWPTSMLFRKGHRIRIEISSSNYPRYDRNLNTGGDNATQTMYQIAHQSIHHNSLAPSRIILPVIPRENN
ncbi:MAG: CocE/NonD family hydrolase [Burkholderiaceae bacterium]